MSLLLLDGFGAYEAKTHTIDESDLYLQWRGAEQSVIVGALSSGTQGVRNYLTSTTNNFRLQSPIWTGTDTIIIGMRVRHEKGNWVIGYFENGATDIVSFGLNAKGCFQYDVWGNGPMAYPTIPANVWAYVEMKVYFHASNGTVDFWINGSSAGSYTGLNTGSLACDSVLFGSYSGGGKNWGNTNCRIADLYLDDATVRGPMEIWYQPANADGSAEGFTPLSGSNYQMVDDLGSDDDATYNSSSAASTKDQIGHSDSLNSAPLALQPLAHARRANDGTAGLKVGILSGATEDLGDASALGDEYAGVSGDIYEVDPNTSAAWTATNADAAETVYQHV
jgi:hypothetical protein